MGKTRGVHETTPELRNRMVGMYEAGLGLREIAAAVNCSPRTVKRWLNRFEKEGTVETRERCGRKRATTVEQDEAIIKLAIQTPLTAAKAVLPALGLTCSVDTVRERLHKAGIHSWTPSRKYMQRIPLGSDADGAAIQQAVWRPTGTQLGKKKTPKDSNKIEKTTLKKKSSSRKVKAEESYVGDGAPTVEIAKEPSEPQAYGYSQQNIPPAPNNAELQTTSQPTSTNQPEFGPGLSLPDQSQPIYQHPGASIVQNWPLDLVQSGHHYSQEQPNPMNHKPPPQHQLQELHSQGDPQHHMQQVQQSQQRLQEETGIHSSNPERQPSQIHVDHQVQPQPQQQQLILQSNLSNPPDSRNISSDNSNSCSSFENSGSSNGDTTPSSDMADKRAEKSEQTKKGKKKGGKVKGTLETSVEIRNRMIGMSEAGLSTLSIALAIDRSERTVKRWLERWHKEGNVQTKERKGRRRITTKEQDEAIVAMATQHPLTAAKYVAPALGLKCSVDTIRERLHKAGIHSWKLGKKQGEGNAVHTVHLWQPSGNRLNKPKMSKEKKRKTSNNKKQDQCASSIEKKTPKKEKSESTTPPKVVPPPANMVPEQASMTFHNPPMTNYASTGNIMQPIHNIAVPPPTLPQPHQPPPGPPPPGPQSMQPMGPIMQQRPDCRLAPAIVPPVSSQPNAASVYASCLVGNNSHAGHVEQPDPLNYEPYIWSF